MLTGTNKQLLKVSVSLAVLLCLWAWTMPHLADANTQGQTIPTAPPPTAIEPTPQASEAVSSPTQPSLALTLTPSTVPTRLGGTTQTSITLTSSPSNIPGSTEEIGEKTTPAVGGQESTPTILSSSSANVPGQIEGSSSRLDPKILIGAAIFLVFIIVAGWYLLTRLKR